MKRKRFTMAIFTALLLAGSANVRAHEECDEPEASKHAVFQPAQNKGSQSPAASTVTVKLFQYQPGKL